MDYLNLGTVEFWTWNEGCIVVFMVSGKRWKLKMDYGDTNRLETALAEYIAGQSLAFWAIPAKTPVLDYTNEKFS